MKHQKLSTRVISLVLTAVMISTMLPTSAFAAEGTPIGASSVECHVTHDDDCGYKKAAEGIRATEGTPCDKACEGEHAADCAYKPATAEVPAVEGALCTHSCELCVINDKPEPKPANLFGAPRAASIVSNENELKTAIAKVVDGGVIQLGADIQTSAFLDINKSDVTFTIDLNTHSLIATIWHSGTSNLTISNGTIGNGAGVISKRGTGNLVLEGITLISTAGFPVSCYKGSGKLTISNSTLKSSDAYEVINLGDASVTLEITNKSTLENTNESGGGCINNRTGNGSITINGGSTLRYIGTDGGSAIYSKGKVTVKDSGTVVTGAGNRNKSSYHGVIKLEYNNTEGIEVLDGAFVTSTGTDAIGGAAIRNEGTGGITINNATVSAVGSNHRAIYNGKAAVVTVSGAAVVTSKIVIDYGTIVFYTPPTGDNKIILKVEDTASVMNTAEPEAYSAYFEGVSGNDVSDYYTVAAGATLGRVFPTPILSVKFDPRNGNPITRATITAGTVTVPANNPTWGDNEEKNNYTFEGWFTGKDGAGEAFNNSGLTASATVYAKWTKDGKTVYTSPIDFSTAIADMSGDGYAWNNTDKKLTLSGVTIINRDKAILESEDCNSYGIILPEGSVTVVLTAGTTNTIAANDITEGAETTKYVFSTAIDVKGGLTITGTGTLNATSGMVHFGHVASSHGIYVGDSLDIKSGTINVKANAASATATTSPQSESTAIASYGTVTIAKEATVSAIAGNTTSTGTNEGPATCESIGIFASNNVIIDGATVTANTGTATYEGGRPLGVGIRASDGTITIADGNVMATGVMMGMSAMGDITFNNSNITASGTDPVQSVGINSYTGNLIINGGSMTAKGSLYATMGSTGITVAEGATVTGSETDDGTLEAAKVIKITVGENTTNTIVLVSDETKIAKHAVISFAKAITFDARNGVAIEDAEIDTDAGTVTVPANNPTWGDNEEKNNYTFEGWFTGKDGAGTEFENKNLTDSATVYAKWKKNGKTVRTETLDLTGSVTAAPDQGWTWKPETKTLTINGVNINVFGAFDEHISGIKLPDGAIVEVQGTNGIQSTGVPFYNDTGVKVTSIPYGIFCDGALTIGGSGTLDVGVTHGAYAYAIDTAYSETNANHITIKDMVKLNLKVASGTTRGDGISASGELVITGADISIVSNADGMGSQKSITINDGCTIDINADIDGMQAVENITVNSGCELDINAFSDDTYGDGMYAEGITINGGTIDINGGVTFDSELIINGGNTTVNSDYAAIMSEGGKITVTNGTVTATATGIFDEEDTIGLGMWAPKGIEVTGGNVNVNGYTFAIATTLSEPGSSETKFIVGADATITGSAIANGVLTPAEVGEAIIGDMGPCKTIVLSSDKSLAKHASISFVPSVSFNTQGGSAVGAVEIKNGTIEMPAKPTFGTYTFDGWYTDTAYTTTFVNSGLTGSATVYAKWTKNGKTVLTAPLDLTDKETTDKLATEGWKWDKATKTLTLSGLTLSSTALNDDDRAFGVIFPDTGNNNTIILTDGTENTVDVSGAKDSTDSEAIYSIDSLTIKTSGNGIPGKLNAIAASASEYDSIGIYCGDTVTIESGDIVATTNEGKQNSVGISADIINIKNGKVTATGDKANGTGTNGSTGLYAEMIIIDGGIVNATGSDEATLSAGIAGMTSVALNGGIINAKGKTAAVAALANGGLTIKDISDVTVNGKSATVGIKNIGMNISTLVDGENIITDAAIRFKAAYTGTANPIAPNGLNATKTNTTITLEVQAVPGETVEYGYSASADGEIAWQIGTEFAGLTADTTYYFVARVKATAEHKSGATSGRTAIKTNKAPAAVSGTVNNSDGSNAGAGITVTLTPSSTVLSTTTDSNGKYTFASVPEGVYSLTVTKGGVTITDTVIVAGSEVTGKDISFLVGGKNTLVESTPGTPAISAGGTKDLLNDTNIGDTLTNEEKTILNDSGSVAIKVKADANLTKQIEADKGAIEAKATGKKINVILDLSVLKTVKNADGDIITDGEAIPTLAKIIDIVIPVPASMQGKAGLEIYRLHGGKVETLTTIAVANKEYYTLDTSNSFVTLHVKNFSTYAMGVTAYDISIADGGVDGASSYIDGETVTINAGSKSGYSFKAWEVTEGDVILADISSATTKFIMPSQNVKLVATWTYTGGGTIDTGSSTENETKHGTVSISPENPSKGQTVTITTKPDDGYVVDKITAKDANGNSVDISKTGENTYTFVQLDSKITVEVTFKKAVMAFTDVNANDWFYDAVMDATNNGWFNGTSDTTFSPNAPTSRGMIATILHRIEGLPSANATSFNDVPSNAYFAGGVAWAETNRIISGYGNGSYGPNDNITREQLASILYRYAGYMGYDVSKKAQLESFTDASGVSSYAKDALSWAVGSGLISGRESNTLAPVSTATRAEAAIILVRFMELFNK